MQEDTNQSTEPGRVERLIERRNQRRRTQLRFYAINILLGVLIAIALFVLLAFALCEEKKVTVKGSTIYSEADVEARVLDDTWSKRNCVYAVLRSTFVPKKDIPFIDSAKVKMTNLNSIEIIVKETPMSGYFTLNDGRTYAYFGADGVITDVSTRLISGVPQLTGLSAKTMAVGQKLPTKDDTDRNTILSVIENLKKYKIIVSSLGLSDKGEITAQYENIILDFGTRSNLQDKMKRLPYILPQIEGMSGTLHMENWTPDNTDIIFEKSE